MKTAVTWRLVGLFVALGVGCLLLGHCLAGERGERSGRLQAVIEALRKGDAKQARALAAATARGEEELEHVMELFEGRVAYQRKAGAKGQAKLESLLEELAKAEPAQEEVQANAALLAEIGYKVTAVALVTEAMPPRRDQGKKTKARWQGYAESMGEGGAELVKAAQGGSAQAIREAAVTISGQCKSCHNVFRGEE